mmetsp:Transcript_52001/g.105964  ORF Transcript_52001/g.105964 Transcript_52001/m.105964 type:complete len:156 (+) Transcript_52001:410-877(+)
MGGVLSGHRSGHRKTPDKQKPIDIRPNDFGLKGSNGKIASMPGVGIVGLQSTTKTVHTNDSLRKIEEPNTARRMLRSKAQYPSTVAPSVSHISAGSDLEVVGFRLGANKPPVCIVFSEEVLIKQPLRKSCLPFISSSSPTVPWEERGRERGPTLR